MEPKMKKLTYALAVCGLVAASSSAFADDLSVTGSLGVVSNYLFRGITQTSAKPAVQGGINLGYNGIYAGVWGSNVNWLTDFQGYGSGSLETDWLVGYAGSVGDVSYDVGATYFYYPGTKNGAYTADTTEGHVQVGYKWVSAKYSYYFSDGTFGFSNSRGSDYLEANASVPFGDSGFTGGAHVGHFKFKNNSNYDYTDWNVSVAYALPKAYTVSLMYSDTDANDSYWVSNAASGSKLMGKSAVVVSLTKSF
jgi:uncharacterized protein (TIGR02001 family)